MKYPTTEAKLEAALKLLSDADEYLRDIRTENLDGSDPALGMLLEEITDFWIEDAK